jgi:hypothetical protein
MTALNTPNQTMPAAVFDVYVKAVYGTPPEGGIIDSASDAENGWSLAGNLRFNELRMGAWPRSGTADFERLPLDGVIDGFELGLFGYGPDDQVRVVMVPPTVGTSVATDPDPTSKEGTGVVVFEGSLQITGFGMSGATATRDESETVTLVGTDVAAIDNLRPEHYVIGRWYAQGTTPTPVLIDGPSLPCVFNAGGRPNRSAAPKVDADTGEAPNVMQAYLFSSDGGASGGDPAAEYWTVKEALRHLVVCWLFGILESAGGDAQGELPRAVDLEPETYSALFTDDASGDRWGGLDKLLPEVDVQNLGVFDAIHQVCEAAGYRMAVLPRMGRPLPIANEGESATRVADRLYELRLWRAGAGPENALRIANREGVNGAATAAELLADFNVSRLGGVRDSSSVRNNISACGRTLIETTVELKPMWDPADVDDLSEAGGTLGQRHHSFPKGLDGDPYHQRHVKDGKLYEQYKHVGRLWGLDETGAFASTGYDSGDYEHDAAGFDWLTHLGIDGEDDLTAAREANGVDDPIRWAKRPRTPLKLSRPESVAIGQAYKLEVSEDGGSYWYEIPQSAATLVREGFFGIMLTADNLATVNRFNAGAQSKGATALPSESWWALFNDDEQLLRFRITCLVEADHAARFDAPIDAGAITRTPRAMRVDTRLTEVWQSPSSTIGDATWKRLDDGGLVASAAGADRTDNLKDLAERLRDERGQLRYSIGAESFIAEPSAFAVGDVVTGIDGRNLDFGLFLDSSGTMRYPSIVGMTITGWPEREQKVAITIGDEAARRGV